MGDGVPHHGTALFLYPVTGGAGHVLGAFETAVPLMKTRGAGAPSTIRVGSTLSEPETFDGNMRSLSLDGAE
jgi:hypothetical protein